MTILDDERLTEIARGLIPPTDTPTHCFVASANRSVIEAYHGLFRTGSPAFGGAAELYNGDPVILQRRAADQGAKVAFGGKRSIGSRSEDVADVAAVLAALAFEAGTGGVWIAHVTVGPTGVDWVRQTYAMVLDDAMQQGILPFRMYETADASAAEYLLESLTRA